MPSIIMDEIGYLGSAAYFAGMDWHDVVSFYGPYYGYGYGILIFPLLKLFSFDMMLAYKMLIVINTIMVLIAFCCMNYVFKDTIRQDCLRCVICLMTCFYPSIIHNTQFAWSETLLFAVFAVVSMMLKLLIERPTPILTLLSVGEVVYMYSVHQRTIGICACLVIAHLYILFFQHKEYKLTFIYIIFIVLCMILTSVLKHSVVNHVFTPDVGNILSNQNDYSGQVDKLLYIFSLDGISRLFVSIIGKIGYLGLSSLFLAFEGLYACFSKTYVFFVQLIKRKRHDKYPKLTLYSIWLFCYVAMLLCAAVFHLHPTRIDVILYGRYTDWMIFPFVILGVVSIDRNKERRIAIYVLVELCSLLCLESYIEKYSLCSCYATCSPITHIFREYLRCDVSWVKVMFKVLIFVSILVLLLLKNSSNFKIIIMCFAISAIWVYITEPAIDNDIKLGNKEAAIEIYEQLTDLDSKDVYYIDDNRSNFFISNLQYLLANESICNISMEEKNKISNGDYIVVVRDGQDGFDDVGMLIFENNDYMLYTKE